MKLKQQDKNFKRHLRKQKIEIVKLLSKNSLQRLNKIRKRLGVGEKKINLQKLF